MKWGPQPVCPGVETSRFAPSTTGRAHPGTLLAGLLVWLDARSRGARLVLRLEDLDPERCRPEYATAMSDDLAWLGLDFDHVQRQSQHRRVHEAALDRLAEQGRLYPCSCSRSRLRAASRPLPDGGLRYSGSCRGRPLPPGGWRASAEPLRVRLPTGMLRVEDESGLDLSGDPERTLGDPIVRRRDGSIAYHLASVVDDAWSGVTRVVRGRDLAAVTAVQVRVQQLLGLPRPRYRHHLLLLEEHGGKLAKLHRSLEIDALRPHLDAASLRGFLAHAAGLLPEPRPTTPRELLEGFSWSKVGADDRLVRWRAPQLSVAREAQPG